MDEQTTGHSISENCGPKRKVIAFDRRKELYAMACKAADSIVNQQIRPEEMNFFLGLVNGLLDKRQF